MEVLLGGAGQLLIDDGYLAAILRGLGPSIFYGTTLPSFFDWCKNHVGNNLHLTMGCTSRSQFLGLF